MDGVTTIRHPYNWLLGKLIPQGVRGGHSDFK